MATENRIKVRRDELPVVLGRKEPTFLKQNSHGDIICPNCNAGYLRRDAGKDDKWSCTNPSCVYSGLTVFNLWMDFKESLSDALYDDMAEYYGIEVENEPQEQETASEGKMESVDDIKEASLFKFANAGGLAECFASMRDKTYTEVKTGFNIFDDEKRNFYGGLHDGLYILGAVSSLGKTTFCFQLAEQIATLETPVLYFSLEQSAQELIAKGISRRMYQEKSWLAKSSQELMSPRIVKDFNADEKELMEKAIKATAEEDKDLYIFEGSFNGKRRNLANIREQVLKFSERYKKAPVVFIDYLQIIPPDEKMLRCTEKQITDEAVSQLKEISRSFKTPVIAISSFNRDSYTKPLKLSSFKESGGIEYTADVVIGMHHAFVYEEDETKEEKHTDEWYTKEKNKDDIRKKAGKAINIKLAVLKNRNGSPFLADLEFVGKFACFREPDREKSGGKQGSTSVKSF